MDDQKPNLIALRDRREAVIQRLSDGFSGDLLEVDAFEERLSLAHQATSVAALDALVADLGPQPADRTTTALAKLTVDPALAESPPRTLVAVFSSLERRGGWAVPKHMKAIAVFGNTELDFCEARFSPGETLIEVRVVFGHLEIIVPPQLAVECEGTAVFASFENHGAEAVADPERPLLRIRGVAVFGNVEVSTRLPGESLRQARKRLRRQRHALRRAERRGLAARSEE
jgi:hypothetical protein